GLPDVAVLDNLTGNVAILRGNGNGTFQTARVSSAGTAGDATYLAYADLNHDGNLDLAVANKYSNSISIILGVGDGSFRPPHAYLVGNYPASLGIMALDDGSFAILTIDAADSHGILVFSPGDGRLFAPELYVAGSSAGAERYLTSIAAADLDGDNVPDVVV